MKESAGFSACFTVVVCFVFLKTFLFNTLPVSRLLSVSLVFLMQSLDCYWIILSIKYGRGFPVDNQPEEPNSVMMKGKPSPRHGIRS